MDPYEYNPQEMIEYMGGYETLGQKYEAVLFLWCKSFKNNE